jgi:signal transduction histidine kinase
MALSLGERSGLHRTSLGTKLLVLGFACTLLLGLATLSVVVLELGRVQRETARLADEGQHATDYIGDIGEQLARLRLHVTMGVREAPTEFARQGELLSQIESNLQRDIDGLATGLDPITRERWDALAPEVARHRAIYADVASSIMTGDAWRAEQLLAADAPSATVIHDALDDLEQVHREQMLRALETIRQRTSHVGELVALMGGTFVVGMLVIWGFVIAMLRQQRHQLDEYTTRLETANGDLDAFAGRVAHDLTNALAPIVMAPAALRRLGAASPQVLEVADRTERCSRRAITLVSALLAFSRAAQGVQPDEQAEVEPVLKDVLEEIAPLAAQLDASIELGAIPDLHVRCSPGLLHTVLANLCNNAVKYLEGRDNRRVSISVSRDGAACRIEVADTGRGIPKEAQAKIFQPFFRIERSRVPGSGIGLATVRRILDARGGRIAVQSAVGVGSSFVVWLPLVLNVEGHRADVTLTHATAH